MLRATPAWIVLGIVCGFSLLAAGPVSGQERSVAKGRRGRPGSKPGEVITRPDRGERWSNRLQVGSLAPEFKLTLLPQTDKQGTPDGTTPTAQKSADQHAVRTVTLRDLRAEQPVVLIFGSMTCPPFRGQLEGVDAVYDQFKDRAKFLFVYVREAHPDSILSVITENGQETLLKIPQPTDSSTRTATAAVCQRTAILEIPIAVDMIDNRVGKAYAGWPNRMVVVGTDGRIIFASDPAPRGTDARRLRAWLSENL